MQPLLAGGDAHGCAFLHIHSLSAALYSLRKGFLAVLATSGMINMMKTYGATQILQQDSTFGDFRLRLCPPGGFATLVQGGTRAVYEY